MELQANRRVFEQNVQKTMKGKPCLIKYVSRYLCSLFNVRWLIYLPYTGGTLNGVYFERCLK